MEGMLKTHFGSDAAQAWDEKFKFLQRSVSEGMLEAKVELLLGLLLKSEVQTRGPRPPGLARVTQGRLVLAIQLSKDVISSALSNLSIYLSNLSIYLSIYLYIY